MVASPTLSLFAGPYMLLTNSVENAVYAFITGSHI